MRSMAPTTMGGLVFDTVEVLNVGEHFADQR